MTTPEQSRTCQGLTEGLCARVGLLAAFAANDAWEATENGLEPVHKFQDKRDRAAEFIGRGGCAEFAPAVVQPKACITNN